MRENESEHSTKRRDRDDGRKKTTIPRHVFTILKITGFLARAAV